MITLLDIEADAPLSPDDAGHAARLLALAESLGINPADLDMAVHDAAAGYASAASGAEDDDEPYDEAGRQAAAVNNAGLDKQVTYLVAQNGHEQTERILREAV
ncbi:hypothetical protein ACIQNI_30000 [Streptomyces sp. NPDC091266]|uniref:hypothetical protein n=1 Tax=Streptomyces sp. NPDC091266 TaxID=3365978 RepID=UPI0038079624